VYLKYLVQVEYIPNFAASKTILRMDTHKLNKDEKLEKELKSLVSKMKNENTALKKILTELKTKENDTLKEKDSADEPNKKQ